MVRRSKTKRIRIRNKSKTKHIRRKSKRSRRKNKKTYKGGYGPGAGPLGSAWIGKDINTWPGVAGVPGQSNFLPLSKVGIPAGPFDPPISTRNMNGGGLIPQPLVDFGRSLTGSVQETIYGLKGVNIPDNINSSPTNQPTMDREYKYLNTIPSDINSIHQQAGKMVASI
jgi:hypothetical protein